jgi:hypothetical protein
VGPSPIGNLVPAIAEERDALFEGSAPRIKLLDPGFRRHARIDLGAQVGQAKTGEDAQKRVGFDQGRSSVLQ